MAGQGKHERKSAQSGTGSGAPKNRLFLIGRGIMKNAKIIFPIIGILVIVIAVTIILVLRGKSTDKEAEDPAEVVSESSLTVSESALAEEPFLVNGYENVNSLVESYFKAMQDGNVEVVSELHDNVIKDTTKIRIQELSKYISSYPFYEVYTKPGPAENSYMAYVYYKVLFEDHDIQVPGLQFFYICSKENGELYIRNEAALDESEVEYIRLVEEQEDVQELKNRVTAENDEIYLDETNGMYAFMEQLTQEVDISVGKILAERMENEDQVSGDEASSTVSGDEGETEGGEQPVQTGVLYATTTDTINVRSSDSITADKVDRLEKGSRVEVLEKLANGWCRINFNKKEAYVKTDYLKFDEVIEDADIIGTVRADTNVNVRLEPEETADRLGIAIEGETYDLLENKNGWCKIKFDGKTGYVKAEFVTVS